MKKLSVLASAFSFDPREPSSIGDSAGYSAWKMAEQISRFTDLSVLTTQEHRDAILEAMSEGALSGVSVHFINVPRECSKPRLSRHAAYRCGRIWNQRASECARDLQSEKKFDAAHHLSPGPSWLPNFLGTSVPLPFIWGPLTRDAHWLERGRTRNSRMPLIPKTWERTARRMGKYPGLSLKCAQSAKAVLIGDPDMAASFPLEIRPKTHVFPAYGIDSVADVSGEKSGTSQDKFKVASTASFLHENGLALAVEAFLHFHRKFPNSEWIIFTGDLEQKQSEKILHNLDVKERISVHPPMGRAEAREKLRNCDVFVNLSLRDNADAWLIESMAAGLPVISLSFGGQGFLIQDDWGIKVKLDNREKTALSIAEALERLLIHSKLRRRMARAAIKNAANCTWHRLGKKLQGIYGEAFLQEEDVRFSRKGKDRFFY